MTTRQQYGAGLEQLAAQEITAANEMRKMIADIVAAAEARGAKVSFFMDEIIIEEQQS